MIIENIRHPFLTGFLISDDTETYSTLFIVDSELTEEENIRNMAECLAEFEKTVNSLELD